MSGTVWRMFIQLMMLIVIYHIGNGITSLFHLRIPGNVAGMLLLLLLLWLKIIKLDQIELVSSWLLKHLGFFFIPISVGLMTLGGTIIQNGIPLLIILVVTAFIGLILSGKITQKLIKRKEAREDAHDNAI